MQVKQKAVEGVLYNEYYSESHLDNHDVAELLGLHLFDLGPTDTEHVHMFSEPQL